MNARPGPESDTWSMDKPVDWDMKPNIENMSMPASKQVASLKNANTNVSLFCMFFVFQESWNKIKFLLDKESLFFT